MRRGLKLSSSPDGPEESMNEVVWISLIGILLFGGAFLLLCPEWWSSSLGTLKDKKPEEKKPPEGGATQRPEARP